MVRGGIDARLKRCVRPHKENRKMSSIPTGTELARPFMPAKDFDLSKRFYEALGFEKVLDSEVAIFNAGSGGFILQRAFQEDWAGNFMMQLMVDDLDAWWAHIESLELSKAIWCATSQGSSDAALGPSHRIFSRSVRSPLARCATA
jgi:hypothetical protein